MNLGVVVLAAGLGTRMRSARPKVLHEIAGRPLIGWVLSALADVDPTHTVVVVGHGADEVRAVLPDGVDTALQEEQLGTGHATRMGLDALSSECDRVLVLCGDTPLLRPKLIADLIAESGEARVADIAGRLGVAQPTATKAVARLQREGLAVSRPYRGVFLTEAGAALAERVRARHRTVVDLLIAVGVPAETAELDAEGLEHHVSERTLKAFEAYLARSR